jgi:hypothetical protein
VLRGDSLETDIVSGRNVLKLSKHLVFSDFLTVELQVKDSLTVKYFRNQNLAFSIGMSAFRLK